MVRGETDRPASISLTLTGRDPRDRLRSRLTVNAPGRFTARIRLPSNVRPGTYLLGVAASSGNVEFPSVTRRLRLVAPREGVIDQAIASGIRGGPASVRLPGRRTRLWVRFRFAALPKKGLPAVIWIDPSGRSTPPTIKPRATLIESGILQPEGLLPGRWRILVKVRSVVVKRITIRIG